jgi:hypothetical protein
MNKRQAIIAVTTVIVASLFLILSTGCVPPNIHVHPPGGGSGGGGGGGGGGGMEWNTNRPGMDISNHTVANANQCRNACNSHSGCRAWTYVKSSHKCWLKHNVPAAQPNNCCTSGVKAGGGGGGGTANMVNNRNFPGNDMGPGYTVANAGVCRAHCNSNPSCRAYTYVKGNHKCWLKHTIPLAQGNSCCVSGNK